MKMKPKYTILEAIRPKSSEYLAELPELMCKITIRLCLML